MMTTKHMWMGAAVVATLAVGTSAGIHLVVTSNWWQAKMAATAAKDAAKAAAKAAAKQEADARQAQTDAKQAQTDAALATALKGGVNTAMTATLTAAGVRGRASWSSTQSGASGAKMVIVTVEIPEADAYRARVIGTKGVVAVRNQFYRLDKDLGYRVTVNGPSPGPGLVLRYGSARFQEGGQVRWESAR